MEMSALDRQMTCPTCQWRTPLRSAAVALTLLVAWLSAACARNPVARTDPTATYVPPPTATAAPTATPVPENDGLQSLPSAEVLVIGSTVVFNGIIDESFYNLFRRTVAVRDAVIKTIQLRSYGGEASLSIEMAE